MDATEITARSILRRFGGIDSWFISFCGMNLYRGCAHDCAYCDGRAEKYRVAGEFGAEVAVKINALDLLRRELSPMAGTRDMNRELWPETGTPVPAADPGSRGFVLLGGGVGDSYQPLEEKYRLSRGALEILLELSLPVHILTKSTLVLRDMDLLEKINDASGAAVSFSMCGTDDAAAADFEPGVPTPARRLSALSKLSARGIPCGVFLLPVIPFVTDSPQAIDAAVSRAREAGARWVVFGGMTLKEGRQKEHFRTVMAARRPEAVAPCMDLYAGRDRWGGARKDYYGSIAGRFAAAARKHRVPPRLPLDVFDRTVRGKARAVVLMEHIHAMLELADRPSQFGWAAYRLGKTGDAGSLTGAAAREARRILEDGTSDLYESLMAEYTAPGPRSGGTPRPEAGPDQPSNGPHFTGT